MMDITFFNSEQGVSDDQMKEPRSTVNDRATAKATNMW